MKQILLLSLIAFSFASCRHITGSGHIVKEKRTVENFTGLIAGGAFEVEVRVGSPVSVEVEADDNLMELVKVKVVNGKLRINNKDNFSITDGHLKAYVTVPSLDYIESSGAASVKVLDELKDNEKINLHASGAAHIEALVDAPEIEAESSGAAGLEVKGRTKDFNAHASGSAAIHAAELLSENTNAEASGAATVHAYSSVKLSAKASGAANIFYKGEGSVAPQTSGAANVHKEE